MTCASMKAVFSCSLLCSGRRHRLRTLPGRLGYGLLRGAEEGMTPAELRALPIVIYERRHDQHRHTAFNDLLVILWRALLLHALWHALPTCSGMMSQNV